MHNATAKVPVAHAPIEGAIAHTHVEIHHYGRIQVPLH